MSVTELTSHSITYDVSPPSYDPRTVRVHIAILREADGAFSVIALNLPGAGSCGDTEEEAIENTREAVRGVVHSHMDDSEEIPWLDTSDYDSIPDGAKLKWILVHV